jgi:nicotinamide mononucleotide transporter
MWALARKYLEQWLIWIIVDVACCALYWYKGLPFTSVLYGIYSVIAVIGFLHWKKLMIYRS